MDGVADEDLVVPRGRSRTVAFARDASGVRWALEFLDQEVPQRLRMQFQIYFTLLAQEGRIASTQHFKKERGDIWAFKAGSARIACFPQGRTWFLTHGFIKQRARWPLEELVRAERIRWEHLVRTNRTGGRG